MGKKNRTNLGLTRVEAPTMQEAIEKVRSQLGGDALIVSTRTFRRGGLLGVGSQKMVEVYATDTRARIQNIQRERSSRARPSPSVDEPVHEKDALRPIGLRLDATPLPRERAVDAVKESLPLPSREARIEEIQNAIGQVREEIRELVERTGKNVVFENAFLSDCYELLISRDVDERLAERIVREIARTNVPSGVPDPVRVRSFVRAQLTSLLRSCPPLDDRKIPRVIVLVGPTGVGKTTTIAKLAARAKINEQQRVGLVTLDTFRIAAVDQLEKYAQIIGLPLKVAKDAGALRGALGAFAAQKFDLVFVDSAGRSPRDELKMAELRDFLAELPDAEIHLVVSTTTHAKTIENVANRFSGIGFHMLILTKLDETVSFGSLANALINIGRPVSFVTDGQNVPDDIMTGDPERLADLVLKTNAL